MTSSIIEKHAKIISATASVIYGTIGVVRRLIPLGSGLVAFSRGVIGGITLILIVLLSRRKIDIQSIIRNLKYLIPSGILLGLNWVFLFEAYRYTSVAVATLCNYMAPIFIVVVSPIALKEKLTLKKGACVVAAFLGMVLISQVFTNGIGGSDGLGVLFGLIGAVFYAAIVILNKKLTDINSIDRTIVQLIVSAITLLPYILLNHEFDQLTFTSYIIGMLLIIGLIHTALAYVMYFGSMAYLKGQTIAVLAYIDPVLAVILSVVVLKEPLTVSIVIGAVLIIGATLVSEVELPSRRSSF